VVLSGKKLPVKLKSSESITDFSGTYLTWTSYNNLLLNARNTRVRTDLKDKYAADFKPGYLPVFCVDNRIYQTCRNMQEANLSGIPELRKFCCSIPAKAHFRSANHYIGTELPSLISSVDFWIQAASDPGTRSLTTIVPANSMSEVSPSPNYVRSCY
jgi:hypothetical protein